MLKTNTIFIFATIHVSVCAQIHTWNGHLKRQKKKCPRLTVTGGHTKQFQNHLSKFYQHLNLAYWKGETLFLPHNHTHKYKYTVRNDDDGNQTNSVVVVVFELNHHNYEQINNIFYNLYSVYMWEKINVEISMNAMERGGITVRTICLLFKQKHQYDYLMSYHNTQQ